MNRVIGCDSPIGRLQVALHSGRIAEVRLPGAGPARPERPPGNPLERRTLAQLKAYFSDPRAAFDLPLAETGTRFQQRVWARLRQIPPGATLGYGELARELETSARAVGNACRANPWPILVPCHRVVATAGVGGYAGAVDGAWLEIKRWLLRHEGAL
jgi:methylated-DNA-[protein]-cysteine S-methyltransferase